MDALQLYYEKKKALDKVMRVLKKMEPEMREAVIQEILLIFSNRVDKPGE